MSPPLLEASLGDSVALTQSSFLSILGCCPRGDRDVWQPQLCHLIDAEPPPAPLPLSKVSLGNLQTRSNGCSGSVCYF